MPGHIRLSKTASSLAALSGLPPAKGGRNAYLLIIPLSFEIYQLFQHGI